MDYVQPTDISPSQATYFEYRFQDCQFAIFGAGFMVICTVIGIVILAPMLPPLNQANAAPETIAAFYQDRNVAIRIGLCIMMFGTAFIIPLFSLMGQIIQREIKMPLVGSVQYACGLFGILFTFMMTVSWGTAAFRPERAPEITQMLHDMGWLFATWVAPATMLQLMCICIAVFKDKSSKPVFPRWFGYFNIWMVVLAMPACVINIFNSGPFAYDGLLGFWIPYAGLFAWFAAMMVALWQALSRLQGTIR